MPSPANPASLPADERFEFFLSAVTDAQEVWGLYDDEGWAVAATDDSETPVFPLWPARAYAQACATEDWEGFEACAIALDELLDELLPELEADDVALTLFPTPTGQGIPMSADALAHALTTYLDEPEP